MGDRWYQEAVVYCLDVDTYADSDGDGVGDFQGLIGRLDYLARLGVTCLWLNPIHPRPTRTTGTTRPTSTTSTRAWARSATSPNCCTRRATGASG
ncbi:alpha-amylase family glycosyl hydrolase [Micromonospora sp. BRA006-A]|nr:alpha-amylase family glycosyl hydrolase [Micromonospora sp. BRA006-A]